MIDFWAVMGLAIVDVPFQKEVFRAKDDVRALTKVVNGKYSFHLSRFEVREFSDFMKNPGVLDNLKALHRFWMPKICEVSLTFEKGYVHPKPDETVLAAMRELANHGHGTSEMETSPKKQKNLENHKKALNAFLAAFEDHGHPPKNGSGNGSQHAPRKSKKRLHPGPPPPV